MERNDGGYRPEVTLQQALGGARRVVLTAHVDPDPDALGTALGISHVLAREGWDAHPVCIGNVPSFAPMLPGFDRLVTFPERPSGGEIASLLHPDDVLVVCDTPSTARMEGFYAFHKEVIAECRVLVFDHHYTNERYGDVNFLDPTAAASAEVACDVLDASGMEIDASAATCFMTALIADTQSFTTENTSPRSLYWGHRLARAGAPIYATAQMLFKTRPQAGLRLWGSALGQLDGSDGVLWTRITREMLSAANATMEEVEGLVDFILASKNTRVAIVLKEYGDRETKVSMRTLPGIDATRITGAFGGGGHQRAAGCTIEAPVEEAATLLLPEVFREIQQS